MRVTLPPLNPVLARELKERMRGGRAVVMLTAYLVLLGAILYIVYLAKSQDTSTDPFGAPAVFAAAGIGRSLFETLVFFVLLMVCFLVPGISSGAIAGERERQTLVPLQVTLLRPSSILFGKVASAMAFLVLLLVATAPLLVVGYLFGGVSISQLIGAVGIVAFTGLVLACITVACSTFLRRVQGATVAAYALTLGLVVGPFMLYGAIAILDRTGNDGNNDPPTAVFLVNPLMTTADAVGGRSNDFGVDITSPLRPLKELISDREEFGIVQEDFIEEVPPFPGDDVVVIDGREGVPVAFPPDGDGLPFWFNSVLTLTGIAMVAMALATRRLRTPAKEER